MTEKIAVFAGSFDPAHLGHKKLVERFLPIFDKIIVAVGINEEKKGHYTIDERKDIIRNMFKGENKVMVDSYDGWTVDYCKEVGAKYLIRGMRDSKDFEYEKQTDRFNKSIEPDIETIYIIATEDVADISSTKIKNFY